MARHCHDSRLPVVAKTTDMPERHGVEPGETGMLIQKLRLQRGWSQEQLAAVSGLSTRTIQRIERGNTASLESLKTLAAVFEIDVSQLAQDNEASMTEITASLSEAEEAMAFAHVRRIRQFYMHIIRYVLVIAALAVINLVTSPGYLWVVWPALGLGVGLIAHALTTFEMVPFLTAAWEKKQVENYLGRKL